MKRILVTYVSHSGSTREIADFLYNELASQGQEVDLRPASEVTDLTPYDGVIAGGLLYRFGWHPQIIQFLEKNLAALRQKQVALFVVGMRLVRTADCDRVPYPVFIDPTILATNQPRNLLDGYTTMRGYLGRVLPTIAAIRPVSLGFFAGKVDLRKLALPEKMILKLLLLLAHKQAGDYRNWQSLRMWLNGLEWKEEEVCEAIYENLADLV